MKTTNRERLLDVLQQLWDLSPDARLGQLVAGLAFIARPDSAEAVYHIDDDELLHAAEEQLHALLALTKQGTLAVSTTSPLSTDH